VPSFPHSLLHYLCQTKRPAFLPHTTGLTSPTAYFSFAVSLSWMPRAVLCCLYYHRNLARYHEWLGTLLSELLKESLTTSLLKTYRRASIECIPTAKKSEKKGLKLDVIQLSPRRFPSHPFPRFLLPFFRLSLSSSVSIRVPSLYKAPHEAL
jgi:hypothetical protein